LARDRTEPRARSPKRQQHARTEGEGPERRAEGEPPPDNPDADFIAAEAKRLKQRFAFAAARLSS
jgi:hypothetical protein